MSGVGGAVEPVGAFGASVGWSPRRKEILVERDGAVDVTIAANTLASYVPGLRASDDEFRLRLVLHDFGMVFQHADATERAVLLESEPEPFERRWDAFLAAYAEYLAYHADIAAPRWVFTPRRHLREFWYPGPRFPRERAATILTTPAAFEAHGIWFPVRELAVV